MNPTIRLVLGDQLNPLHSWYTTTSKNITYVFIECKEEASYAPHHIQKVVGIFTSMRDFAQRLRDQGHQVWYHHILDSTAAELSSILYSACQEIGSSSVVCQEPDEYRVKQYLQKLNS
ncbi:MAG TPA: cryptochrome/photolyase family protein, partial [Cryomorphaceae bacterium]|nr:cryptochrome/photolyase family protein [Cryomorphaceae bacterium]